MSTNNADVIKLLRSDRSSDTRALLFYFIIILFYFILFYFILFYFILFYFILLNFILFYFILLNFILFYFILFLFLFYFLFYFIKHLALFTDQLHRPTDHPSPPARTLRRSDHFRFRSLPVSTTSGFDHFRFRSLPVSITSGSDHFRFPPRTLRRPAADLAQNVSDNIRCDVINPYLLTWRIWRITKWSYLLLTIHVLQ